MYKNDDVTQSNINDNDVFYLQQFPSTILVEANLLRVDMSNANNPKDNAINSTLFIIIGIVVGIVIAGIVLASIHSAKNPKSTEVEFQPVRKNSIADFLASKKNDNTETNSVLEPTKTTTLNSAFRSPAVRRKSIADILAEREVSNNIDENEEAIEDQKSSTVNQAMSSLLMDDESDASSDESEVEEGLEGLF
jgi:hypothetical protein